MVAGPSALLVHIRLNSLKFLETEVLKAKSGFEVLRVYPPPGVGGGVGWS